MGRRKVFVLESPIGLFTCVDKRDYSQLTELAATRNQTRSELLRDLALDFLRQHGGRVHTVKVEDLNKGGDALAATLPTPQQS